MWKKKSRVGGLNVPLNQKSSKKKQNDVNESAIQERSVGQNSRKKLVSRMVIGESTCIFMNNRFNTVVSA